MRVGASTGSLYPQETTEDAIDRLAGLGFAALELVLQTPGEYAPAFARLLARRARDAAVPVHAVHSYTQLHPLFSPYARRRREGLDLFRLGCELAAEVGAACVVWHGLTLADHERGAGWEAFREAAAALAALAAGAGVRLALENVSWCVTRDAAAVHRVRAWRLPLGFTFDPFQAVEAGVDAAALLAAMDGQLVNVHLSDARPGDRRHLPAGEGVIDWPGTLIAVRRAGYDGPLILEGNCEGDLDRLRRGRDVIVAALDAVARR